MKRVFTSLLYHLPLFRIGRGCVHIAYKGNGNTNVPIQYLYDIRQINVLSENYSEKWERKPYFGRTK